MFLKNATMNTLSGHSKNMAKHPMTVWARLARSWSRTMSVMAPTPLSALLGAGTPPAPVAAVMSMVKWPYLMCRWRCAEGSSDRRF